MHYSVCQLRLDARAVTELGAIQSIDPDATLDDTCCTDIEVDCNILAHKRNRGDSTAVSNRILPQSELFLIVTAASGSRHVVAVGLVANLEQTERRGFVSYATRVNQVDSNGRGREADYLASIIRAIDSVSQLTWSS